VRVFRAARDRRIFSSVVTAILLVAMVVAVPGATSEASAGGYYLYSINGAPFGISTPIHVLTFNSSQYVLKIGLAHDAIDAGEQTASSMCQSTPRCVAAVNGDFFDVSDPHEPVVGDEVGGIIRNCVLLHTPETAHEQVDLDGSSVSEGLNWSSSVDVNGVSVPITAISQELPMKYLGVDVPLAGTLLFTAQYALATPVAAGRVTYEFVKVGGNHSPTTINTTSELRLVGQTSRPVRVTPNHVDISATSGSALASLNVGTTVSLTTTSTAGCDNIGGHPILLNEGVVGPINRKDTYMASPYARTMIGWTATGDTVIVSVGGTDDKSGATMYQMVTLLLSLDVVTALDLGESATLFAGGQVLYPTLRTERPVSTSLLVVSTS
jgi:exopolysaccharide biosynthesis protein